MVKTCLTALSFQASKNFLSIFIFSYWWLFTSNTLRFPKQMLVYIIYNLRSVLCYYHDVCLSDKARFGRNKKGLPPPALTKHTPYFPATDFWVEDDKPNLVRYYKKASDGYQIVVCFLCLSEQFIYKQADGFCKSKNL